VDNAAINEREIISPEEYAHLARGLAVSLKVLSNLDPELKTVHREIVTACDRIIEATDTLLAEIGKQNKM
jgi:hypothetical protein